MDVVSYLLGKKAGGGGGGGNTPQSFNDIEKELKDLIKNTPNSYETYTSNNITLYTPDVNYQKYCIYKNNNKYRVAWLYTGSGMYINDRSYFGYLGMNFTITSHNIEDLILNLYLDTSDNCYRSDEYNSIEECIQAIQSNSTSYSTRNINIGIPMSADTPYIIPYTNASVVDYYNGEKQLVSSKKLSSNETIQVIS